MSHHPVSTYRALIPSLTTVLATDEPYASRLASDSPYYTYVQVVDKYEKQLRLVAWGPTKAESLVIDDGSPVVPRENPIRSPLTGKMSAPTSDGLMKYTTAVKLVDIIAWLNRDVNSPQEDILQHQRRGFFVANSKPIAKLAELHTLVTSFSSSGLNLHRLLESKKTTAVNSTSLLASEIVRITGGRHAMTVLKNLALTAFGLHIMLKGFVEVPESYESLGIDGIENNEDIKSIFSNIKSLRQPLRLCVNVSPLLVLTSNALDRPVCNEEVLLTMKAIGNQKPQEIRQLEQELWQEIFQVALGVQTSYQAFKTLQEKWKMRRWDTFFGVDALSFFPKESVPYSSQMSLYDACIVRPIPLAWPIPAPAHAYISPAISPSSPTPSRNGDGEAGLEDDERDGDGDEDDDGGKEGGGEDGDGEGVGDGDEDDGGGKEGGGEDGDGDEDDGGGKEGGGEDGDGEGVGGEDGDGEGVGGEDGDGEGVGDGNGNVEGDEDKDADEGGDEEEDGEGDEDGNGQGGVNDDEDEELSLQQYYLRLRQRSSNTKKPLYKEKGSKGRAHRPPQKRRNVTKPPPPPAPARQIEEEEEDSSEGMPIIDNIQLTNLNERKREEVEKCAVQIIYPTKSELIDGNVEEVDVIPSLDISKPVKYYSDLCPDTFQVWTAKGESVSFKPRLHTKADHLAWINILSACEQGYLVDPVSGQKKPRFLHSQKTSAFVCMTEDEFLSLPVKRVQSLIAAGKNIVKTDCKRPTCKFDLAGLETLTELDRRIEIQDQSIPVQDGDYQIRVRKGTVMDLYKSTVLPSSSRSLNALDFPHSHADISASSNASDVRAYNRTKNDTGCSRLLPTQDMRWGIAATAGAHHYWHLDSRGEGTFVFVCCGEKIWIIATPKNPRLLSETTLWYDLDVTKLDPHKWHVEMVLLQPGDELLMAPCTAHCVITKAHSICHGGHYLALAAISRTVIGTIHTFFRGNVITNTDHPSMQYRMNSLACFLYKTMVLGESNILDGDHIPDIMDAEAIYNLLLFCCGIELQNVLCPLSYMEVVDPETVSSMYQGLPNGPTPHQALRNFDFSIISHDLRIQNIYSRGRVNLLLSTLNSQIQLVDGLGACHDVLEFLFYPMLSHLLHSLSNYYSHTATISEEFVAAIPEDLFQRQLLWSCDRYKEVALLYHQNNSQIYSSLFFQPPTFSVQLKANGQQTLPDISASQLLSAGMRQGDIIYTLAYNAISDNKELAKESGTLKRKRRSSS